MMTVCIVAKRSLDKHFSCTMMEMVNEMTNYKASNSREKEALMPSENDERFCAI
jgi:hypothetical protein